MGYRKLNFGSGSQAGLSLVELMIALVLGLLLSTGVVTIFISAKQDYQVQDAISQVQENGRFSLDFLAYDIRMAGFSGCSNEMPTANTVENAPPSLTRFSQGIEGYDGDNETLPSSMFPNAKPGTDAIVVHVADMSSEVTVVKQPSGNAAALQVSSDHGFEPGAILMVVEANCSNQAIFVMTNTQGGDKSDKSGKDKSTITHNTGKTYTYGIYTGVGNCTKAIKGNFTCDDTSGSSNTAYSPGSSVFSVKSIGFYIREDGASNVPTLYKVDISNPSISPQPLVEGVSDLDVLYGVYDESADTLEFKDADVITAANEWGKVTTVQLEVVADSLTQVDGAPVTRRYVRTVKMRNR